MKIVNSNIGIYQQETQKTANIQKNNSVKIEDSTPISKVDELKTLIKNNEYKINLNETAKKLAEELL